MSVRRLLTSAALAFLLAAPSPAAAQEVHAFIRRLLEDRFNKTLAMEKRIVYGGSVTPENIRDLYAEPDIDGALVGGASLKPEKFLALIKENYLQNPSFNKQILQGGNYRCF